VCPRRRGKRPIQVRTRQCSIQCRPLVAMLRPIPDLFRGVQRSGRRSSSAKDIPSRGLLHACSHEAWISRRWGSRTMPTALDPQGRVVVFEIKRDVDSRARLHDLRHFAATRLLAAGVPVNMVAGRLGDANAATTLNVYGHFLGSSDESAAQVLGTFLDNPKPKTRGRPPKDCPWRVRGVGGMTARRANLGR